ncbi:MULTISPECIES: class I SAM-dependent DNA methyltransferase [Carnobacterium]|uniref:class I SAM-dependent DNA methyltransferase n=1 Tax=Carnobacterium TaxID=2747 RepID=UPI00288CAFBC|nr:MULTISPECIES: class I SAM-dependent DNA methyltransferase [Carnobacterium]MDT1940456.1 type I restriction-modification system subunit M [Carnobacterium divergens]MDT1942894.1 type I restriction-modification system subunit M [Carnobacterium divergens]MDT1948700.1 type I restriction-modification system subunit M [Carnobacterium divergens]MDT1951181.1 type I restriction-modification system subunit M [Carnobacterium divergens]MDT1956239.1 type I restriction-modification system subunit M [Carnob
MNDKQLKKLKNDLWTTAIDMRANSNLSAHDYAEPILGLIFLRFADAKYKKFEKAIEEEFEKRQKSTRISANKSEIALELAGIYVPDDARYDYLLNLPEKEDVIAPAIVNAMTEMERYASSVEGALPKEKYKEIPATNLKNLLKNFKDIPTEGSVDIFGEIYEYFLGKFAMTEGQGGGVFYTPASVVQYMVEVVQPKKGRILDPACGSGGMFVQSALYAKKHGYNPNALRAYGVEKEPATVKLAQLNLLLHNMNGDITQANSFYEDPYTSYEKFDFVFANPPFNVRGVEYERVCNQKRFNEYGIPRNSSKNDEIEKVPNANYLWINQFATALKKNGKAALVMPNGASTAGDGGQKDIRKRLLESGHVSQIVVLPSNMFNTVTLPATLWFFDKSKKHEEVLFINADKKELYTQVDRAHRKFDESHIKNLALITRLYEGNTEECEELKNWYQENIDLNDDQKEYWQKQLNWVNEHFTEGMYQNIAGLCSVVPVHGENSIESKDWSLSPGLYVGVEAIEVDEEPFEEKMERLITKLSHQFEKSHELESEIKRGLGELNYEL